MALISRPAQQPPAGAKLPIHSLSRKKYGIEERYGCTVTKITDTAPGALRLDMTLQ
jgi:hypothetical protein